MLRRVLTDDIFISYARADASAYADGLVAALESRGLSAYADRLGTEASSSIPSSLLARLKGASLLVVVGSSAARHSVYVLEEVRNYSKARGSSRILLVEEEKCLAGSELANELAGIARDVESTSSIAIGRPSESVIDRIDRAFVYARAKARIRRYTLASIGALAASLAAAAALGAYSTIAALKLSTIEARLVQRQGDLDRASTMVVAAELAASSAEARAHNADLRLQRIEKQAQSTELATVSINEADRTTNHAASTALAAFASAPTDAALNALIRSVETTPQLERIVSSSSTARLMASDSRGHVAMLLAPTDAQGPQRFVILDLSGDRPLIRGNFPAKHRTIRKITIGHGKIYFLAEVKTSTGRTNRVFTVDIRGGGLSQLNVPERPYEDLLATDDARLLATYSFAEANVWKIQSGVILWDAQKRELLKDTGYVYPEIAAIHPNAQTLALFAGCELSLIGVLDGAHRHLARVDRYKCSAAEDVRFIGKGEDLIVTESAARTLGFKEFDLSRRELRVDQYAGRVIASNSFGRATLIQAPDGRARSKGSVHEPPTHFKLPHADSAAVTPDGRWLVLSDVAGVRVYDLSKESRLRERVRKARRLPPDPREFHTPLPILRALAPKRVDLAATDPSGTRIVLAVNDGMFHFFDAKSELPILSPMRYVDVAAPQSRGPKPDLVRINYNGSTIVTLDDEGNESHWNMSASRLITEACRLALPLTHANQYSNDPLIRNGLSLCAP